MTIITPGAVISAITFVTKLRPSPIHDTVNAYAHTDGEQWNHNEHNWRKQRRIPCFVVAGTVRI